MTAANIVKYGLSNVYIAPITTDGWKTPIHIIGGVTLTLDPAGDESDFYGDNKPLFTQRKNNGYTGSLEVSAFPDEVLTELLGWYKDENGKFVEDADGKPVKFALMCQVEGDVAARRIVWYECEIARPSTSANTTEASITPQTDTVNITVVPHYFETLQSNIVRTWCYKGDADYDTFFNKVVEPSTKSSD